MANPGYMFTEMLMGKQARQAALDQQAAEFNARQGQRNLENSMGAMQSLGNTFKGLKQDSIANNLMNQQDPSTPHTGGMDEMKLNLAMDTNRRANLANQLSQQRLDLSAQRIQSAQDRNQIASANAASRATSQDFRNRMNGSMSYFKNLAVYQKAVDNAINSGDQNAYMQAAQTIQGLYHGAVANGLKSIQEPLIPDFAPAVPETTTGGIFGFGATKVPAKPAIKAPPYNGGDDSLSGPRTPSQRSIDALMQDPSLADQFDATYGPGSSSQYLNQ